MGGGLPRFKVHLEESRELKKVGMDTVLPLNKKTQASLSTHKTRLSAIDLYELELGLSYSTLTKKRKPIGASFKIGSASDKPFKNTEDATYTASAFFVNPSSERTAWTYMIFISNNNPLLNYLPIPGVLYTTRSENFQGTFGIPINSLRWKFHDKFRFDLALLGPFYHTELIYQQSDKKEFAVGSNWFSKVYLLDERDHRKDRLFQEDKKLYLSMREVFSKKHFYEIKAGQVFDRKLFSARNFGDKKENLRTYPAEAFISFDLIFTLFL